VTPAEDSFFCVTGPQVEQPPELQLPQELADSPIMLKSLSIEPFPPLPRSLVLCEQTDIAFDFI